MRLRRCDQVLGRHRGHRDGQLDHGNKGPGVWADTNNAAFRIEGNLIEDNDGEGIFYEISYNARIVGNTLRRNGLVKGRAFAARGDSFPVAAIYLSEAGGDPRVAGGTYSTLEVAGNVLEDNWGGVVLWENADRFCNSAANTSTGYCPPGGAASPTSCAPGTIVQVPFLSDCRWKTANVSVHDNDFRIDKGRLNCLSQLLWAAGRDRQLRNLPGVVAVPGPGRPGRDHLRPEQPVREQPLPGGLALQRLRDRPDPRPGGVAGRPLPPGLRQQHHAMSNSRMDDDSVGFRCLVGLVGFW